MINRLKKRFIILAMVSLTILLSVIVAGMNIINYNSLLAEADRNLSVLAGNRGRLPSYFENGGLSGLPGMSRDEAEELRFFSVLVSSDGETVTAYLDRIYAVDEATAFEYAGKALREGRSSGFVRDYRYSTTSEGAYIRITFMDCGRLLRTFRHTLYSGILMSLAGLAAVFGVLMYFAGRIVRPVAESYEKQKRFITDAGHEIRTPLTIIKANLELIRMELDGLCGPADGDGICEELKVTAPTAEGTMAAEPEEEEESGELQGRASEREAAVCEIEEFLAEIDTQADRLTALTNDLVYLSRMDEGTASVSLTEVALSEIAEETASSFEPLARGRGRSVDIQIEPQLFIRGTAGETEKLVSILVENAVKYSPEGDTVRVRLYRNGRNAVLEVKNRSEAVLSEAELRNIFERFYRPDVSRNSSTGGNGIGLATAKAIVSAFGGKISASSQPLDGDAGRFIVSCILPLCYNNNRIVCSAEPDDRRQDGI